MAELTRKCKKCSRSVPARDVRIQPDGSFLCFDCAGYAPKEHSESRAVNVPTKTDATPLNREKIKYHCLKCKYQFYLKEGHAKRCPYCSGSNIEEKQGEAQRLIDMNVPMRGDN